MPQKENSTFVVNSSSQSQTSKSLNDSLQDISSFSDNEQYQNLEESEEEEYIESDSVTQFKFKEYIDFPKMSLFDRPQGYIQPIPEDYIFKDLLTYLKTMNILEKERFFKKIRDSLKKNVFKREDRLKNEREVSTYEDFQWIQDYEVADIQFSSNGLILLVNSSMKIQKYQQKQWEILNNQIMIFVNKKTKKFFVGKTIDQNDKQQSEIQKLDESSIQNESFQLLVENVKKNELYKDITIDEIKEVEDILKEDCNDFDIINLKQTFQIKMNLLTDIKEFLININQISQNYILLTPHEYWFQTQQILNCQQNFSKLQQIQFYDQTINGQKGESKFPEYGFLNGRDDLKQEFMQQMEQQIQNLKELDKYQLQALIYALHNQNAIIQGPPGTGKTYLASHLINTLSNLKQKYCNKPILIISKKNCSLDQLLIQLKKIKSKKKLLRLGYQTTLKEIEKYTVSKQKGPQKYPIYQPGSEQLNEKLQNYIERDKDQDYYQACNSQAQPEEDIDNLSFQIYAKEKEMEGFLQEMRSYEYSNLKNQVVYDSQYQRKLANFMKKFQFIAMTLTGYHTYYEALKLLGAEIVVVEEASEVIESEFFPILTPNLKHLIQFGDHQQLKPMIRSSSLKKNFNYEMSYFERLIKVNKIDYVTLYQQKRMRPEFANFPRLFYSNKYIDDPVVKSMNYVREISSIGMYLLPHTYPDQRMNDSSYINQFEAYMIKFLAKRLSYKYKQNQITILSMYKSQKTLIESKLQKLPSIKVFTVDEFQGNENDIIILSCVRSNKEMQLGYISENHRINVAFSRAKMGFFCIGNFEMYRQKCKKWDEIVELSFKQFSYGGINQLPLYKKVYSLTQFQLEINWYRRGQYQNNQCSTCQERFHIGVCKYASQETNLFDYFKQMFLQFNQQSFQDNQILIFEQEANQNNLRQEVDISQIYQDQTISPKSCSNEFLSIQELINMMGSFVQDKNQNNIKEINKQKAFLTEDESEISFKCTKKQKQKISQKQRKQNQKLSLTQNIQTNLNNSNSQ